MEYIKQAKEEIRNKWFENHTIKSIQGDEGFQRIIWGEQGTRMYQVEYVLSGNMVFVTGDLGDAAYQLTCEANLENIKRFDLSYFTGKLTAHERSRWDFDDKLARDQILEYFSDLNNGTIEDLSDEETELYEELIDATHQWSRHEEFESMGVWTAYNNTSVDWFDGETASCIADCGKRLNRSFIAYWLGLKMVIEQLDEQKEKSA